MKRTSKKLEIPDSEQVRIEATETLVKQLGIAKAALFIRDNLAQKTDYLTIKERQFSKLTATEIYEQINEKRAVPSRKTTEALKELSGIWAGRDVSITELRDKAWRRLTRI